jgi:hypothetical protein
MDVDGLAAGVHFTATIQHVLAASQQEGGGGAGNATAAAAAEARRLTHTFAASLRANACAALSAAGAAAASAAAAGAAKVEMAASGAWAFKKPDLLNLLPFLADEFPDMQVGRPRTRKFG